MTPTRFARFVLVYIILVATGCSANTGGDSATSLGQGRPNSTRPSSPTTVVFGGPAIVRPGDLVIRFLTTHTYQQIDQLAEQITTDYLEASLAVGEYIDVGLSTDHDNRLIVVSWGEAVHREHGEKAIRRIIAESGLTPTIEVA